MTDNLKPEPIKAVQIRATIAACLTSYVGAHREYQELLAKKGTEQICQVLESITKAVTTRLSGESVPNYEKRILQIGYEGIFDALKVGLGVMDLAARAKRRESGRGVTSCTPDRPLRRGGIPK
jgi:hypothetical protein